MGFHAIPAKYAHAESFATGEMKQGFIALIEENFPNVCLTTRDTTYEITISNMQEIKSRNGKIIAVATQGDFHLADWPSTPPPPLLPANHPGRWPSNSSPIAAPRNAAAN